MTQRYSNWLPVMLLCFLHCGLWSLLLTAQTPETTSGIRQSVNLAVFVEGQFGFKRKGWTSYAPVVFGTSLRSGDLLNLGESSHAKVVCSDLTLHDVPSGIGAVPCPVAQSVLQWQDGSALNPTRSSPADGSFPIVISPRRTKLLASQPVLRWTHVSGATAYSIVVRGADLYWTYGTRSEATELVYPEMAPKLVPGVNYKLIVQAGGRSSADESGLGLGFSVVNSKERKTVEKEQRKIEDLGLPDGPKQFLIAYLYATHDLNAEGIERLEVASKSFKAAAVARLLGDLYLVIGLTRQAEARYLNSLDLSKSEIDEEGEKRAHLALATIYEQGLGNEELARQHLDAALALAKKMGDDQTASQAEKRLAELKRAAM